MSSNPDAVRALWTAFSESRFLDTRPLLADDFNAIWPVSRERIPSPENYLQIQIEYPGTGWITVDQLIDDGTQVVTICSVNWNNEQVTAISLFAFDDGGKISSLTEWWPEEYAPPVGREHLTERY